MRPRIEGSANALIVTALLALPACSGPQRHESDASPDGDADSDADSDSDSDADGDFERDSDIDSPDDVPHCGDGVLDAEEECDDRNRLNGDGCDWLCRLGDGEPPLEPDSTFPSYGHDGEPVQVEGQAPNTLDVFRIPLLWTGSELATAFVGESDETGMRDIFFERYDIEGSALDSEYEILRGAPWGFDLVWTGEGFALFYTQAWDGIYLIRLSRTGKLLSGPTLVVDDGCADTLGADFAGRGLALTWGVSEYGDESDSCHGEGQNPEAGVHLALLANDSIGAAIAGPTRVLDEMAMSPDVAAGDGGFGVASSEYEIEPHEVSFVRVDEDMGEMTRSGVLSQDEDLPSVVFANGEYWVAWGHSEIDETGDEHSELCIARFSTDGMLVAAPVCSAPEGAWVSDPRIAFGDGGLGIVAFSIDRLLFLRTDSAGSIVGEPLVVTEPGELGLFGPYAIAWADTAFVVLYAAGLSEPLRLRRFVEAD
jgi:cysteine-rich repeat protein